MTCKTCKANPHDANGDYCVCNRYSMKKKKYAVYFKAPEYIGEQMIHVWAFDEDEAVNVCKNDGVGFAQGHRVYAETIVNVFCVQE